MTSRGISALKFVGTVSLGLLTGVSYTASAITLPSILALPSSSAAAQAAQNLVNASFLPLTALTSTATTALTLAFILSPRSARHPYLVYTALLGGVSGLVANFIAPTPETFPTAQPKARSSGRVPAHMEASYEVLGDAHSEEATSDSGSDDVNGEEVRAAVEALAKGFLVRTGVAALGFAMAVVGIWGDGSPQALVLVS